MKLHTEIKLKIKLTSINISSPKTRTPLIWAANQFTSLGMSGTFNLN